MSKKRIKEVMLNPLFMLEKILLGILMSDFIIKNHKKRINTKIVVVFMAISLHVGLRKIIEK